MIDNLKLHAALLLMYPDADSIAMNASITSLGALESVGGDLYPYNTPITSLGALESVVNLEDTPITSLGALKSVGGDVRLDCKALKGAQERLGCPPNHSPRVYTDGKKIPYQME